MKIVIHLLLFFSTSILAQKSSRQIVVDSGFVYKNYHSGLTTAHLAYTSICIDTINKVTKTPISKMYLDTLSTILTELKHERHLQQKMGRTNYSKVYIKGIAYRLAFFDEWGILDVTKKPYKQIVIRDTNYADIYRRFILNNWY